MISWERWNNLAMSGWGARVLIWQLMINGKQVSWRPRAVPHLHTQTCTHTEKYERRHRGRQTGENTRNIGENLRPQWQYFGRIMTYYYHIILHIILQDYMVVILISTLYKQIDHAKQSLRKLISPLLHQYGGACWEVMCAELMLHVSTQWCSKSSFEFTQSSLRKKKKLWCCSEKGTTLSCDTTSYMTSMLLPQKPTAKRDSRNVHKNFIQDGWTLWVWD